MPALPDDAGKTNLDNILDDAGAARGDLVSLVDMVNGVRAYLAALLGTDGEKVTARTTLEVRSTVEARRQLGQTASTAGTAPAYTATLSPALASYAEFGIFTVKLHAALAAGGTIAINGLPPKPVHRGAGGGAVGSTDTVTNQMLRLVYNGSLASGAGGLEIVSPVANPYDIPFNAGFDGNLVAKDIDLGNSGQMVMCRSGAWSGESGYLDVAATGAVAIVDVEKNGVTIYATKPQWTAGATAMTAGVLKTDGTATFAPGDRVTFKVVQRGSALRGQGLRFSLRGSVA